MNENEEFINFRPILVVALVFILGILLPIIYAIVGVLLYAVVVILALTLIYCLTLWRFKTKRLYSVSVFVIATVFFVFGNFATLSRMLYIDDAEYIGKYSFSGYVLDVSKKENVDGGANYSFVVKGDVNGKTEKVYVSVFSSEDITAYTNIEFTGYITPYSYGKGSFDINFYPLTKNIRYIANYVELTNVGGMKSGIVPSVRSAMLESLKDCMPETYAISYALLTGETSLIDYGVLSNFRTVGVSHIFAVSGLHVGFLYKALELLLKIFKLKKNHTFLIITPILFLYVWLCGFTASCLRAFAIITVNGFAKAFGFKNDTFNTVALSVIIVLFINPLSLFSIGFLLSYLAYIGIVVYSKPFAELLCKILPVKVANFLSSYIVAFLATMPICIDAFGYLSPFGILFNILIVPIIGVVYVFSFICCFGLMLLPILKPIAVVPEFLTGLIVKFISAINSSAFILRNFAFGYSSVFYYSSFVMLTDKFNITKKERTVSFLTFFLLFVISFTVINVA